MSTTPVLVYGQSQLQPYHRPDLAVEKNVNLLAGTYASGQVLGQVTVVQANAVQTITITGTATNGSFTVIGTPFSPYASTGAMTFAWNSTIPQAQAVVESVYGPGNVIVSGTTLPGGSLILTFVNNLSAQPIAALTAGPNNLQGTTPNFAIAQTTPGVSPAAKFGAYAHGNSDGTQIAKCILRYGCTVDSLGNITFTTEIPGYSEIAMPAFFAGYFRIDHLVGVPTAGNLAVDFPGARLVMGDLVASGILALGV